MKKFLVIIAFILLSPGSSVQAETVRVRALEKFSTERPSDTFRAEVIETEIFENGFILHQGSVISGKVVYVAPPKRGKRDAYFEFLPTSLTYEGITKTAKKPMAIAKVAAYSPVDTKKLVGKAVKTAANLFVKGVSLGISFAQGVAQADDGENRFVSGVEKTYKDSPLSYIEVGDELNIDVGDELVLIIQKIR